MRASSHFLRHSFADVLQRYLLILCAHIIIGDFIGSLHAEGNTQHKYLSFHHAIQSIKRPRATRKSTLLPAEGKLVGTLIAARAVSMPLRSEAAGRHVEAQFATPAGAAVSTSHVGVPLALRGLR